MNTGKTKIMFSCSMKDKVGVSEWVSECVGLTSPSTHWKIRWKRKVSGPVVYVRRDICVNATCVNMRRLVSSLQICAKKQSMERTVNCNTAGISSWLQWSCQHYIASVLSKFTVHSLSISAPTHSEARQNKVSHHQTECIKMHKSVHKENVPPWTVCMFC